MSANMENILQLINKNYISLPEEEVKRNNAILQYVLNTFVERMKTKDPLFKAMFRRVFYGGSYYDGLKVGTPEEFDLDLLLCIPKYCDPVLTTSNIPGFVHLQLRRYDAWMRQPEAMPAYKNFRRLFDEQFFLDTYETLSWLQGIIQRVLNDFPFNTGCLLQTYWGEFEITFSQSGPALTLHISGYHCEECEIQIDVDLVPCFVFGNDKWPVIGYRSNPFPSLLPEFFIVPKSPKGINNYYQPASNYWRLSFQEQERALIDGKERLKPTIKLLKKLRDNLQHKCIASYYIKTVLLHIIAEKDASFWRKPLNQVFMTVLKEYNDRFIRSGNIPYYWNRDYNLIGNSNMGSRMLTMQNFHGRLTAVIRDIENNPHKPETIAKYLLDDQDLTDFEIIRKYIPESSNEQPQSWCVIL